MKAMMSENLRNLLSNPESARELQKQLLAPKVPVVPEKPSTSEKHKHFVANASNRHHHPSK